MKFRLEAQMEFYADDAPEAMAMLRDHFSVLIRRWEDLSVPESEGLDYMGKLTLGPADDVCWTETKG